MRLIDADNLDKRIYEEIPIKEFGTVKRMARMREIIAEEPTIGDWISVKDRLPETGTLALVFGSAGAMTVARYIAGAEWVVPGMFSAITHWMPLPAPPKV